VRRGRNLWADIGYGIVRWLIFVVALSLLPVGIGAFSIVTRDEAVDFIRLLGHGELLLISTAVVGSALADLVSAGDSRFRTLKLSVGGGAALVVLAAAVWFAQIATVRVDGSPIDREGIAVGSLVLFGLSVVSGLSCILVSELAKEE
jgi:hypothetical protein